MIRPEACVDSLRLTSEEIRGVLEELERAGGDHRFVQLRRDVRYRYAVKEGIRVHLDGQNKCFIVRPRNISASGISFLHGSFLYPGARCRIALRTTDGEHMLADAKLVRCRCVRGRIHEVAAVFDERIDIECFVNTAEARSLEPVLSPAPDDADAARADAVYESEQLLRVVDGLRVLIVSNAPRAQVVKLLRKLTELLSSSKAAQ